MPVTKEQAEEAARTFGCEPSQAKKVQDTANGHDLTAAEAAVAVRRATDLGGTLDRHVEAVKRERIGPAALARETVRVEESVTFIDEGGDEDEDVEPEPPAESPSPAPKPAGPADKLAGGTATKEA